MELDCGEEGSYRSGDTLVTSAHMSKAARMSAVNPARANAHTPTAARHGNARDQKETDLFFLPQCGELSKVRLMRLWHSLIT